MTQQTMGTALQRVHLDDPADVAGWIDRYGCSEDQLRAAVDAVGPVPQDVREHLAKQAKEVIKRAT